MDELCREWALLLSGAEKIAFLGLMPSPQTRVHPWKHRSSELCRLHSPDQSSVLVSFDGHNSLGKVSARARRVELCGYEKVDISRSSKSVAPVKFNTVVLRPKISRRIHVCQITLHTRAHKCNPITPQNVRNPSGFQPINEKLSSLSKFWTNA